MKTSVLVVGHADADGHLIAEQTRRNLSLIEKFDVTTVVDPDRTKDHKAWTKLDAIGEIEDADIVFFVDLMFAPASFDVEAKALVEFVNAHPEKQFFLIDHHPLPLRRLSSAENLRVLYRPEVFDCAIGPRSGMMIVAALCEGQDAKVADIKEPVHVALARGMRRAAALGGDLPGEKLLALLRGNCWEGLLRLGEDNAEFHRLPRGRRPLDQPQSNSLRQLNETAEILLAHGAQDARISQQEHGRAAMAYDIDIAQERFAVEGGRRARVANVAVQARDLETIITILEIAAISLTTAPDATFTRARLIQEARAVGGPDIDLLEEDIDIVLQKQGFLKKVGKELCLR